MPDEGPFGSQPLLNSDNQRNCNGDFMNSGLPKQLSWLEYNAGKEFVQALLETNSLTANGSVFGENTQAIQQHFMTTNPGGLMNMKLWWGELVIPNEVSTERFLFFFRRDWGTFKLCIYQFRCRAVQPKEKNWCLRDWVIHHQS